MAWPLASLPSNGADTRDILPGLLSGGVCGEIKLDILGRVVAVPTGAVAQLRDLAAARAGLSSSHRDLSLVLDRALRTQATIVLQRGAARALLELIEEQPPDTDIAALVDAVRGTL